MKSGIAGLNGGSDQVVGYANSLAPGWTIAIDRHADDVPEEVREELQVHLVSDVAEVLRLALEPAHSMNGLTASAA